MKNYSKQVIDKFQEVINNGAYESHKVTSEVFPKVIYANGVKLQLLNGDRADVVVYYEPTFNREDVKEWKKEGFGKFITKEWKKQELDRYEELSLHIDDNITAICLVRCTADVEGEDATYYYDLNIEGKPYCIIKAYVEGLGSYSESSHFEEHNWQEKIVNIASSVEVEEDSDSYSLKDASDIADPISEELF